MLKKPANRNILCPAFVLLYCNRQGLRKLTVCIYFVLCVCFKSSIMYVTRIAYYRERVILMRQIDFIITSDTGLHARPAGLVVKEAGRFSSNITVVCGDKRADAKKIFSLLTLGAKQGDLISVIIEGQDEQEAADALEQLAQEYL